MGNFNEVPGPAYYEPIIKKDGIQFSMRQRNVEKDEEETPGPGGYDIKSKAVEGKSVKY